MTQRSELCRMANRWLTVPSDGYFLACTNKKDIKILFRTSEYECLVKHNSLYTVDVKDITHWQPLPEPPKEE